MSKLNKLYEVEMRNPIPKFKLEQPGNKVLDIGQFENNINKNRICNHTTEEIKDVCKHIFESSPLRNKIPHNWTNKEDKLFDNYLADMVAKQKSIAFQVNRIEKIGNGKLHVFCKPVGI